MDDHIKIGVLAAQGAFAEHIAVLNHMNIEAVPVRVAAELKGIEGLIIPGGESTTISRLILAYDLVKEIGLMAAGGLPIFGTCAGMIMIAKTVIGNGARSLGLMDIRVRRNAFGRQIDSFETNLSIPALGEQPFPGVFIRAPRIESVDSNVDILAKLDDGTIVAARQDKMLATAFHPELTNDLRFHRYFLDIVSGGH
jgi:5'-phosphate synthase pdxT subunit